MWSKISEVATVDKNVAWLNSVMVTPGKEGFSTTEKATGMLPANQDGGGKKQRLGGGFNCFLYSPLPGEMIQFD